ncbi:nucleoside phosphorylase domain-containing protein [Zopfochytrium polystomum]|nr:nucleoside phosphorylase domain-containing protein [Zopfochytrium polystomum]
MGAFKDANFPLDGDGRTYHVGTKDGETANRVLTVGDYVRAERIATAYLDPEPAPIRVKSKRGFLTITGAYKGVPVSIVSIGMGTSMMDFFVREVRAVVDGPLHIIRFGSCGSIADHASIAQVMVNRNYDYFLPGSTETAPYLVSKAFLPDPTLTQNLLDGLTEFIGPAAVAKGMNATADSFYSSQGRIDSPWSKRSKRLTQDATSLEMETGMLFHLAQCSSDPSSSSTTPTIKAAGAMMVFADRTGGGFITPEEVERMEGLGGKACLGGSHQGLIVD